MTTPDIQQARAWAEEIARLEGLNAGPRAAAEVIQALPDTVVDGDKLREVINKVLANTIHGTVGHQVAEDYAALIGELIPAPSLPTLADMTPEEREACQWRQATIEGEDVPGVILRLDEGNRQVTSVLPDGVIYYALFDEVTPLPGEPKLEWPGSGDVPTVAEQENVTSDQAVAKDVCNCRDCNSEESSLPRPEDVPAGEAWIVQHEDREWIGCRNDPGTRLPWLVIGRDRHEFNYCYDSDVTLVSRLVPEDKP